MSTVICIWAATTLALCVFSFVLGRFVLGRLPVLDSSPRPWVMHRSYVPDPDHDSKAAVRPFRRPPRDLPPPWRVRG
jgi:hypothetical protein